MSYQLISSLLISYVFWPLLIWSLFWKGIALWKAGTRKERTWFIIIFLVNTAGILEIVYLLTRKPQRVARKRVRRR